MDFIEKLWTTSFKKWNFFYELHEFLRFDQNLYDNLYCDLLKYSEFIEKEDVIDKNIMKNIFNWMNILSWIETMYHEWKIVVEWVSSDDLYDYQEKLILLVFNKLLTKH